MATEETEEASTDSEEVAHIMEMVVWESVAPEGAVSEVALEAVSVDKEVVDLAADAADTAVGWAG